MHSAPTFFKATLCLGFFFVFSSSSAAEFGELERMEYDKTLASMQKEEATQQGVQLSKQTFGKLSWVGRTAAINYACSQEKVDNCKQAIDLGLADEALVVRDHALRILFSRKEFKKKEKEKAITDIIADNRNYRRGLPLWIVERAKRFESEELR